jgi:DNA-binding LytR/AlgR family response regulator
MKILSVDADPDHAALLERHCRVILAQRLEHFEVVDSGEAAATRLGAFSFTLVLLDPVLRRGDGFDLLDAAHAPPDRVIVVSARTELAMRAFDYGVLDFVPKPARRERLAKALGRVLPTTMPTPSTAEGFLTVSHVGRREFVPIAQLLYIKGSDKYTELVLMSGQREFCHHSLGHLAETLPDGFVRIHRSYLVRWSMIARLLVQRGSRYFAELQTGQRLPVGRSHYAELKARWT